MYCKRCGTQFHPQARFCKKCGAQVSLTRPVSDLQQPAQPAPPIQTPPVAQPPIQPPTQSPPADQSPVQPPPPVRPVVVPPEPSVRTTMWIEREPSPPPTMAEAPHRPVAEAPHPPPARPTSDPEMPPPRPVAAAEVGPKPFTPPPQITPLSAHPPVTNAEKLQPPAAKAPETTPRETTFVRPATADPVVAPPTTGTKRRRWLLIAAIGLAIILLATALFWWMWSGDDTAPETGSQPADQTAPPGMVYAPGGELTMGNDAGGEPERPAHQVTVKPFFIDRNEVTCEEYARFIAATGHRAPANWAGGQYPAGFAQRPVTGVDWDDANAYATWAGKRLPTEAEWEFAARGADGRRYTWGNEWKPGLAHAEKSEEDGVANVGSYPAGASVYGVNDLIGNAWEWTASDWVPYPGGTLPTSDLPGPLKVIRGGCYQSSQGFATATIRSGWPARGHQYPDTGFRCAKNAPASSQ